MSSRANAWSPHSDGEEEQHQAPRRYARGAVATPVLRLVDVSGHRGGGGGRGHHRGHHHEEEFSDEEPLHAEAVEAEEEGHFDEHEELAGDEEQLGSEDGADHAGRPLGSEEEEGAGHGAAVAASAKSSLITANVVYRTVMSAADLAEKGVAAHVLAFEGNNGRQTFMNAEKDALASTLPDYKARCAAIEARGGQNYQLASMKVVGVHSTLAFPVGVDATGVSTAGTVPTFTPSGDRCSLVVEAGDKRQGLDHPLIVANEKVPKFMVSYSRWNSQNIGEGISDLPKTADGVAKVLVHKDHPARAVIAEARKAAGKPPLALGQLVLGTHYVYKKAHVTDAVARLSHGIVNKVRGVDPNALGVRVVPASAPAPAAGVTASSAALGALASSQNVWRNLADVNLANGTSADSLSAENRKAILAARGVLAITVQYQFRPLGEA